MPNYLDLFAGAGGLSEGFLRAGYEAVAHIEMDTAACYTLKTRAAYHWLKKNNKLDLYNEYLERKITRDEFYSAIPKSVLDTVLNYEISEDSLETIFSDVDALLNGRNLDLIIGGPPCQAYSIAGRSRAENKMVGDERNYLYKLYAEFLKRYHELEAKIMEIESDIEELRHQDDEDVIAEIRADVDQLRYDFDAQ